MDSVRSVYIHVPFCSHRCGYCNFTLLAGRADLVPAYLDALEREIDRYLEEPLQIDTLFLGGGTPSFLKPDELERLLGIIKRRFRFEQDLEYSCEVNPIDCSTEKLTVLKDAGVNRISIGGQSFSARKLKLLERDHSPEELRGAIELCQSLFDRVSLDLIFATPEESCAEWQADLDAASSLGIGHLSTYGLTIEKGSMFFGRLQRGDLTELDNGLQGDLYELAIDRLTTTGWTHYEVSSFANHCIDTAQQCRHNETYWLGRYWWGFGPGAASFLPPESLRDELAADDNTTIAFRAANHASTTTYLRRLMRDESPKQESESLDLDQVIRERVVFGLRRLEGIRLKDLSREFDLSVDELFRPFLSNYLEHGWLEQSPEGHLRLTRSGLLVSDGLWPDLLSPRPS